MTPLSEIEGWEVVEGGVAFFKPHESDSFLVIPASATNFLPAMGLLQELRAGDVSEQEDERPSYLVG